MPGKDLNHLHHRGLISTPVFSTKQELDDWVLRHTDMDAPTRNAERFNPAIRGKNALEWLGMTLKELVERGKLVHLNQDEDGTSKEIDWDHKIQIDNINQVYARGEYEGGGFIAVLNANFWCDLVQPETEPPISAIKPKGG